MGPNITHGTGFEGLLRYLLFEPNSDTPRYGAKILGGSLAGRNFGGLLGEFAMVRRLRPNASKVVMHHSLSYATEEEPSDAQIQRDTERYLEHLGLQHFPYVVVRHSDKEHLHGHIVLSKIGFDREWWDARLDQPRAQIAAALVEREFGLVEMERPKMTHRIKAAWARLSEQPTGVLATPGSMRLPSPGQVLPAPPIPAPKVPPARPKPPAGEDGILHQIRARMEAIPVGLTLPEWVHALEIEGIQVRPSMGGEKISGWWVQLTESDSAAVKLSSVDRAGKGPRPCLGWTALQKDGKVIYDPAIHNDFARRLTEVPFDKPVAFTIEESRFAIDEFPRDPTTLQWDWQPEGALPEIDRPALVGGMVDEGPRSRALRPGSGRRTPTPPLRRQQETPPSRPGLGQGRPTVPHVASRVRDAVASVSRVSRRKRPSDAPGSRVYLAGGFSVGGQNNGPPSNPGQPPGRPGAIPRGGNRGKASPGHQAQPNLHGLPVGGLPSSSGRSQGRSLGSGGFGERMDRGGLEALRHKAALEVGKRVVQTLALSQMLRIHQIQPRPVKVRVSSTTKIFGSNTHEAVKANVNAFFAGGFRRNFAQANPDSKPPKGELVMDALWEMENAPPRMMKPKSPGQTPNGNIPDISLARSSRRPASLSRPSPGNKGEAAPDRDAPGNRRPRRKRP